MRPTDDLAALVIAAGKSGGQRAVTGLVVAAPDASGYAMIDRGSGSWEPVRVPGSVRGVTEGQRVRLVIQDNSPVVDAIIAGTTTPTVVAPPSASTRSPATQSAALGFSAAGYSNAGFTTQDFQVANFAIYIGDQHNLLVGVVNSLASDVVALQTTVNDLRTTVAALRSALVSQGHVT